MFSYLISFVLFLGIGFGANLPLDPIPEPEGRIVGGEDCKIEEAPYQVAALYDKNRDRHFEQICGGSIISEKFVVTAAHCTSGTKASQWKIRAGSANKNKGGQVIPVKKIIEHEKYDECHTFNDISLLLLTKKLSFGRKVSPIALPAQGAEVPDGSPALATGWGETKGHKRVQDYPDTLKKVKIPIVNQQKCFDAHAYVTNSMICAGFEEGGKTPCDGDSGGPLVVNKTLVGITSWGGGCGKPHSPEVFTRVSMYVDWTIHKIDSENQ